MYSYDTSLVINSQENEKTVFPTLYEQRSQQFKIEMDIAEDQDIVFHALNTSSSKHFVVSEVNRSPIFLRSHQSVDHESESTKTNNAILIMDKKIHNVPNNSMTNMAYGSIKTLLSNVDKRSAKESVQICVMESVFNNKTIPIVNGNVNLDHSGSNEEDSVRELSIRTESRENIISDFIQDKMIMPSTSEQIKPLNLTISPERVEPQSPNFYSACKISSDVYQASNSFPSEGVTHSHEIKYKTKTCNSANTDKNHKKKSEKEYTSRWYMENNEYTTRKAPQFCDFESDLFATTSDVCTLPCCSGKFRSANKYSKPVRVSKYARSTTGITFSKRQNTSKSLRNFDNNSYVPYPKQILKIPPQDGIKPKLSSQPRISTPNKHQTIIKHDHAVSTNTCVSPTNNCRLSKSSSTTLSKRLFGSMAYSISSIPVLLPKSKQHSVMICASGDKLVNIPTPITVTANVKSDQSLITDPRMSSRTIFIRHENILEDVIDVFKDNFHNICAEHDFRLCSKSQVAPGPNGDINRCQADISRTKIVREHDMNGKVFNLRRIFTLFWKECLHEYFDGDEQKVPKVFHSVSTRQTNSHGADLRTVSEVPFILGRILGYGYVICGYWPITFSAACAVMVLTGNRCSVDLLLSCFKKTLYHFEAQAIQDLQSTARAKDKEQFQSLREERRIDLLAKFYGGPMCKIPSNVMEVEIFLAELADYHVYCQPFWWLREMRRGLVSYCHTLLLPTSKQVHKNMRTLHSMTEECVRKLYSTLTPSPEHLSSNIVMNVAQLAGSPNSLNTLKALFDCCLLRLSRKELAILVEQWTWSDCLLDTVYIVDVVAKSSKHGAVAPPVQFQPWLNVITISSQCAYDINLLETSIRQALHVERSTTH